MKKEFSVYKYELIGTIFIIILGTILHFTYAWSNNNTIVGIFSSVNESTWEHLKLIFFPFVITTIIGLYLFCKNYPNYLCSKTKGLIISLSFIILFFYTYTGILGSSVTFLNIGSFIFAIILGQYYAMKNIIIGNNCNNYSAIVILILLLSFITFTFIPPKIGLFNDPVTNTYGIYKSK